LVRVAINLLVKEFGRNNWVLLYSHVENVA